MLAELALRDRPVALVAVDQRMPRMTGIEVLAEAQSRGYAAGAKRVLLTAYADTDVAIQAINDIGLDHYLMKPWDPPEERLFPVLDDLLGDWHNENPDLTSDVRVVDHRWSERGYEVKTFLARNHVPYRWFDVELDEEGKRLAELAGATAGDLPLVLPPEGEPLRSPTNVQVADALGLRTQAQQPLYDVCIVGGGPAGLASAVYAASEGLSTIVVEGQAPGGQAGTSAAIENYLGFPKGLSGADLTQRAMAQVQRFGAEMVLARDVVALEQRGPVRAVVLAGDARDRGAVGDRVDRRLLPSPRGGGPRRADRPRRLLRRRRQRRPPGRGRRRLHRRRRQLRRAGRAQHGPARATRRDGRPGVGAGGVDVAVPRRPHRGAPRHRGAHRQRGDGRTRGRAPRVAHAARPRRRHVRGGGRRAGCSSSSGRSRAPTGSARTWPGTSAGTS